MKALVDSNADVSVPDVLRHQLKERGYVFLRGLLDRNRILEARCLIEETFRRASWIDSEGVVVPPIRVNAHGVAWDDTAYVAAALSPSFNALAYDATLRGVMVTLLGEGAFVYPAKTLRVVYPSHLIPDYRAAYAHTDFAVFGVAEMLTTWIPLMDIPESLGGLAVVPSTRAEPAANSEVEQDWHSARYRAGDVVIFHCRTVHKATPNIEGRLRISGDYRWQTPDTAAPSKLIYEPGPRKRELYRRMFSTFGWWRPVPDGLRLLGDAASGESQGARNAPGAN